ncbi:acyltransferase [Micromonospora sp. WMMD1155]|uniref:acyltransferase family protein n=1 Tax=Micromonospora sp. WMMD1155 TaxID=3016094 RepID=UPI00249A4D4D|nr:acyltransferase [Micromonospora sp. WMMD1155]WFE49292.1 acyltransferase [Micromonospora sp. WMMD1155]
MRGRVDHLDGIRGIAILAVCAVHWIGQRLPGFEGGYIGVDLFFVLSGFIITTLLVKRVQPYGRFLRNRVRRLYPPLVGALMGITALTWLLPDSALSPETPLRHGLVAAVQASSLWITLGGAPIDPFSMTWSLSVEWYFYLLWPLAVLRLRRLPAARAARLTLLAAGGVYLVAAVQPGWWFYYGPLAHTSELLVGAAIAFPLAHGWTPRLRIDGRLLLVAAFTFVALWTTFGSDPYSPAYRLVALPLTVGCAVLFILSGYEARPPGPARLLSWRPLVAAGRISYSLYLWHTLPIVLLSRNWLGLPSITVGVIGIGIAVGGTALSYHLLERPFLRPRGNELSVSREQAAASSIRPRGAHRPERVAAGAPGRGAVLLP